MRVMEDRAGRGSELIVAGFLKAQVKPAAFVLALAFGRPLHPLDVFLTAFGAADYAIGPAHLLDVLQALLVCGKLGVCFADVHGFFHSVKDINSSRISCNRWSRRSWSATATTSVLCMSARFASLISAISF